jgi:glycosyltransferase involved in cell wall biosynthesis
MVPQISVVIATYNRGALLRQTLDGLQAQQYGAGDEVIVVDNASTDDTAQVISRAAARFPVPLRHHREATPGKTAALRTGLEAARGEVLALTDDDVLVDRGWISTIRQIFEDPSMALVGGRVDPMWERPAPRWLRVEQDGRYGRMSSPLALLHYGAAQDLGARTAVGANMAVRRTALDALGGFSNHLGRMRGTLLCGEDHDLCRRAVAAGLHCEYRPELRVRHWVPAERTQLGYFLRWFFWSGVTSVKLGDGALPAGTQNGPLIPRYLVWRVVTAATAGVREGMAARPAAAAERLMDIAFAAGFVTERVKGRLRRRRARLPQPQALPGRSTGAS